MRNNNTTRERGGGPRLPKAIAAGLGALVAAALFSGVLDGGPPPKPARAEAAAPAVTGGGGPTRPSTTRLCFHGSGGEILDFAPRQNCP